MGIALVTPPSVEPVTLDEAKAHLNIIDSADDDLITLKLAAARQMVERYLGQSIVATTFDLFLDRFHHHVIEIPAFPILSIDSVNYLPATGAEVALDPSFYTVDTTSNPARIVPSTCAGWPITARTINAVRIRFVAGYGADADGVPEAIKQAVLLAVGNAYENRESAVLSASVAVLPLGLQSMLDGYRNWSL